MKLILRRLRGITGLGFSWASIWTLGGTVFGAYSVVSKLWYPMGAARFSSDAILIGLRFIAVIAAMFGLYGFISGSIWSIIFTIAERRQTLRSLSTGRVAAWGAIGGAFVPSVVAALQLLFGNPDVWREFVPIIVIAAWLGAGCAAATVNIARRADKKAAIPDSAYSDRSASVG